MSGRADAVDERMMGRALRASAAGRPSPNPHVGAVLARGSRVVSTGFHRRAGEAHAEVMAIRRAGRRARGATLYVTLEPCNHRGRTGPCTDAIIDAGVARVVIGCRDPTPHARGGLRKLRRAGVEVGVGVREAEARRMVADFAKHFATGLPWVTLKAALTLDGRSATRRGDSKWITGEVARREAHRLRAWSDAVLVGIGTVLADDPELTVRHVRGRDPVRVLLDARLRTPPGAKVLRARTSQTIVFHGGRAPAARRRALQRAGARLAEVPGTGGLLHLPSVLKELGSRDVVRLLVEGGATVHGALLACGMVDRAAIFIAPNILGDPKARPLAFGPEASSVSGGFRLIDPRYRRMGRDVLVVGDVDTRARGVTPR